MRCRSEQKPSWRTPKSIWMTWPRSIVAARGAGVTGLGVGAGVDHRAALRIPGRLNACRTHPTTQDRSDILLRPPRLHLAPQPAQHILRRLHGAANQRQLGRRLAPAQARDDILCRDQSLSVWRALQRLLQCQEQAVRDAVGGMATGRIVERYSARVRRTDHAPDMRCGALIVADHLAIQTAAPEDLGVVAADNGCAPAAPLEDEGGWPDGVRRRDHLEAGIGHLGRLPHVHHPNVDVQLVQDSR